MFKRILVPLDGSRFSSTAIRYAVNLAGHQNSEILLFHAFLLESPPSHVDAAGIEGSHLVKAAEDATEKRNRQTMKWAKGYLSRKSRDVKRQGISCSFHVAEGMPGISIIKFCNKHKIDLVVMTTSGRGGLKRAMMGSITDQIIREPGIPVLAIRPKKRIKN